MGFRSRRLQAGAGSTVSRRRTADRARPAAARRHGNPGDCLAPRRFLPVRPSPARRWSGAPIPAAGTDRRGARTRRRGSRRGVADRRLAAASGRHRDRAGPRSQDSVPLYTVNGLPTLEIPTRPHQRLRLRFINGCQRAIIAVKIEGHEVRVMALDGQPAEPFFARGGALVLRREPGSTPSSTHRRQRARFHRSCCMMARTPSRSPGWSLREPVRDAPLPAAAPLPSNGLPARLDLKGALRIELALGGTPADWSIPANFANSAAPAFRVKAGRTVVLALTNRAADRDRIPSRMATISGCSIVSTTAGSHPGWIRCDRSRADPADRVRRGTRGAGFSNWWQPTGQRRASSVVQCR